VQGALAGTVASVLVWILYGVMTGYVPQMALSFGALLLIAVALISSGALLGWLGSFFAVRRFLKNVALH
jgi:cell division transport system permease protein